MVKRCVQRHTGLEFAAKIINTKKLSARGIINLSKFKLLIIEPPANYQVNIFFIKITLFQLQLRYLMFSGHPEGK